MTAKALRTIEAGLRAIIERIEPECPACPYELREIAGQIQAQAEMHEKGLAE